ncbi:Type II secretion system protein D precursor [Pirellulimonas nuda]|uniref:Type II secretion system protein D n=1 Tax=Pirellulimonas nuda TaxID=2528009 RepID=A0A518DES5_9BACT|nr:secretin N-terminal domain-containing protein [Pirellulimonas nuda]QDU89977.1 Type II secretion system protein D precursor [Pirellulimonas nuda]
MTGNQLRVVLAALMTFAPAAASRGQAPEGSSSLVLQAHTAPAERSEAVRVWAEKLDRSGGRRAAWDDRTGQLILLAEPAVHDQVRGMLAAGGKAPASAPAAAAQSVQLTTLTPQEAHSRLEGLTGRPLPTTWDGSGLWLSFPVRLGDVGGVTVQINRQTGEARVDGPAEEAAAWGRVLQAMDAKTQSPKEATGVVSTRNAPQQRVRQALQAVQAGSVAAPGQVRPVTMLMQAPEGEGGQSPPRAAGETPEEAASLLGPVQIEFVEGLDIIIVRGAQQDVERVMSIIGQIENISAVTVPAIEVYPLENVDSRSMATLLDQVYQQVLGPRTGSVSITPLGKPNALLLIGRTENVQTAIELAKKLDQPVKPETRFRVFPLQHASASDASQLVRDFLDLDDEGNPIDDRGERGALAPRALVVPDFRTNSLIVSASPSDLLEVGKLLGEIDTTQSGAVDEVRIFQLRNTLAEDLKGVLDAAILPPTGDAAGEAGARSASLRLVTIDDQRRLDSGILTGVKISADARANALVVTAPTASMELIAALIAQLDKTPDATAELKVFTIINGDAVALEEMLRDLFGTDEAADIAGVGASSNAIVRLQFSVDERTNSIIAAGGAEDLAVVEAILLRLDDGDNRGRETRVYRLKNSPADEVALSLNELLDAEREAEQAAQLAISPFAQIDREVLIVSELNTNSLIVSATDPEHVKVAKLIDDLDERPPMVLVQVLIAEVRLNDTDEFGVELGLQDSLLFDRSLLSDIQTINTTTNTTTPGGAVTTVEQQTVLSANQQPGFAFNNQPLGNSASTRALSTAASVAAQGLSSFGVNRVNSELGFGGFVFAASSNSISMLLRALQENRRLEVLSRPQIMCLDNQVGFVQVGQSVPTITGVQQNQFGGQTNTVQYRDVGIILQVQPRISVDGQVTMTVQAQKSAVGSEIEGLPISVSPTGEVLRSPRIDITQASTTVSALSGQTVLLSGLLTKSTSDIHRRVPLISDIPLLGDLFRYDSVSQQRTELLIVLTPRIVRDEQDNEQVKQVESARMSWVLCDVINMHGPSGLRSRCDEWGAAEAPSVYPTYIPGEAECQPVYEGMPIEGVPTDGMPVEGMPMEMPIQQPDGAMMPMGDDKSRDAASDQVTPASYASPGGPVRLPAAG